MGSRNSVCGRVGVVIGVFVALLALALVPSANATPITIDSFDSPAPIGAQDVFFVAGVPPAFGNPNPTTVTQYVGEVNGVIGGERETYVEVKGTPSPISAAGIVGAGVYQLATFGTPGTYTTLTYNGGPNDPLLLNGRDLTSAGTNDRLELWFNSIDSGDDPDSQMALTVEVTSGASTASKSYQIPESAVPSVYAVPFADFAAGLFGAVDAIKFTLNDAATPVCNVDFELDRIVAVPEPATWLMLLAAAACVFVVRRSRKS